DGYLQKEAAASTIVQRIREVMWPRARVEARLARGGEVRGRLDGLTPRLVLELCCKSRENLRICFQDAFFSYSLNVRRGCLLTAERTNPFGGHSRGGVAIKSLLGMNAGRFLVVPDASNSVAEFDADLRDILAPSVEHARRCQRLLSYQS